MRIIVNYSTSEKRFAIVENNRMKKVYIDQPTQSSLVGNIYLGIVTKVLPGLNAVFIDIGEDKQGFLHRDKLASYIMEPNDQKPISNYVHQGERLLVQVEKDITGDKGPRLTGNIELQGDNLIYMPFGGFVATSQKIESQHRRNYLKEWGTDLIDPPEGIIFRTSSSNQPEDILVDELGFLREEYNNIIRESLAIKGPQLIVKKDIFFAQLIEEINQIPNSQIIVDDLKLKQRLEKQINHHEQIEIEFYQGRENVFSAFGIDKEFERALKNIVWLDNGSYLIIDETEALTVIDVNSGKFVGKSSRQLTVNQVNKDAAIEIARQIVLRDLSGIILVDFIDMKYDRDRQQIIDLLSNELSSDKKKPKILNFTELGILQLTRRRTSPPLSETVLMNCPTCKGTGRILAPESVAFKLERELWEYRHSDYMAVSITTTDDVLQLFSEENAIHKQRLETSLGFEIHFTCVNNSIPFYTITKLHQSL